MSTIPFLPINSIPMIMQPHVVSMSSSLILLLQQQLRKDDDAQRALFKTYHVLKHLCDFEGVAKERLSE